MNYQLQNNTNSFILVPSPYDIFVGRLPSNVQNSQILEKFSECGEIVDLNLICRKSDIPLDAFAFIKFRDQESVIKALKLDGSVWLGQSIKCELVRQIN